MTQIKVARGVGAKIPAVGAQTQEQAMKGINQQRVVDYASEVDGTGQMSELDATQKASEEHGNTCEEVVGEPVDKLDDNLARAVNLAAWLIRTHRQPPPAAFNIASRKYDVDITEVARAVGARGGRRAARLRRQTAETENDGEVEQQPPESELLDCVVVELLPSANRRPSSKRVRLRPLESPAGEVVELEVPFFCLYAIRVGDVVEARVSIEVDGRRTLSLPTRATAKRHLSLPEE